MNQRRLAFLQCATCLTSKRAKAIKISTQSKVYQWVCSCLWKPGYGSEHAWVTFEAEFEMNVEV